MIYPVEKALNNYFGLCKGVYGLYQYSRLVYIGQSQDIVQRIKCHVSSKKILFDGFSFLYDDSSYYGYIEKEKELIRLYMPIYNVHFNPIVDYERKIASKLEGLSTIKISRKEVLSILKKHGIQTKLKL